MRIRKRTPARAASPGPSPARSPSPPPTKEVVPRQEEDDDAEEKRVILVAGPRGLDDGRVVPLPVPVQAASICKKNSAGPDGAPKPEEPLDAAAAARCNRNDGKRWRCKNADVPGHLFCDRHASWSARQRQPRANKKQRRNDNKDTGCGGFEPVAEEEKKEEPVAEEEKKEAPEDKHVVDGGSAGTVPPQRVRSHDDGFYYYGGFQPGGRKRARGGGPGPAGGVNQP